MGARKRLARAGVNASTLGLPARNKAGVSVTLATMDLKTIVPVMNSMRLLLKHTKAHNTPSSMRATNQHQQFYMRR